MKVSEAVSLRLNELIKQKDTTTYKVFKNSGLDRDNVYKLVNGKKNDFRISTIIAISNVLDISIQEFFNSPYFDKNLTD